MQQKTSGLSKTWKWIGLVILALMVITGGISLYFSLRWKPVLTQKIKEIVYKGSKHQYRIDFQDIHLNILSGSVTVDRILLAPDTAVFNSRKRQGTAATHLFRIRLEQLQLRRISILSVYFDKKIEMNDIILEHPSINMIYNKVYKHPDTSTDKRSLYQRISKTLRSVHIKGIKIENADFNYVSGETGMILNTVNHLNIQIKDFLLDAHSGDDPKRFYYTKDVFFEIAGYHSLSKNKMYTMKVDSITGSATGKYVHLKGFKMIPMYPDLKFSRMLKVQKDRYDLRFDQINLQGLNFIRLNTDGVLHAQAVVIRNAGAKVFMNREMKPGTGDKSRNFPHMALKRVPVPVIIDTLKLQHVAIAYTEYNPITQQRGTVNIDQLNGHVMGLSNDSAALAVNHHAIASLDAYLVKAAQLHILINFDLASTNAAFTFKGHVGEVDMVKLNPLSEALGLLKMQSGQIQKIDFDARANAQGSHGTMQMYYNNLKVILMKEGEDGQPAKKKGLLSFIANTFIIKDANPEKGKLRTAQISYARPEGASFFNLLWKTVLIGMRETVGVGFVPMKGPKAGRKAVVEKMQERKEKRKEKTEKAQEKSAKKTGNTK